MNLDTLWDNIALAFTVTWFLLLIMTMRLWWTLEKIRDALEEKEAQS